MEIGNVGVSVNKKRKTPRGQCIHGRKCRDGRDESAGERREKWGNATGIPGESALATEFLLNP